MQLVKGKGRGKGWSSREIGRVVREMQRFGSKGSVEKRGRWWTIVPRLEFPFGCWVGGRE